MTSSDANSPTSQPFVRGLFLGRLEAGTICPYPEPDAETAETIDEIASMVTDWANESIDPVAIDEGKSIPDEVIEGLKELGLTGLTIPEEYGGAGMGQLAYAKVMEALSHRCASTVTVLGAHLGLGAKGILLYGTDEQKQRWLPDLASGERI
ncbi:MAG: acyl-CoA dehydrogenase family protein 9, partial [Gammaproteobacteria bacterium]